MKQGKNKNRFRFLMFTLIFSFLLLWLFLSTATTESKNILFKNNSTTKRELTPQIIISDNLIYGNNVSAIHIRGNRVCVEKCQIYQNGNAGIVVDNDSQVTIQENQIHDQEGAGIIVMGKGSVQANIVANQIYQNKMAGLHFGIKSQIPSQAFGKNPFIQITREKKDDEAEHTATLNVRDNRIYANGYTGLKCQPEYPGHSIHLMVSNNIFLKNRKGGIFIGNKVTGVVHNNSICENGKAGIASNKDKKYTPQLDIYQNTIRGNEKAGLDIIAANTGPIGICNNWILNNGGSGIRFKVTPVRIVNNTIVSNGNFAEGSGIEQQGKKTPFFIANNILAYNFKTGLSLKKRNNCSHNILYANAGGGNCCDDCYTSSKLVAGKQLGGGKRNEGDLICDPFFQNPDLYDFRLKEWSPAIDAGIVSPEFQDRLFPPSQGGKRNDLGATGGPLATSWDTHNSRHLIPAEKYDFQ